MRNKLSLLSQVLSCITYTFVRLRNKQDIVFCGRNFVLDSGKAAEQPWEFTNISLPVVFAVMHTLSSNKNRFG